MLLWIFPFLFSPTFAYKSFTRTASSTTGWYVLDQGCFGYMDQEGVNGNMDLKITSPNGETGLQVLLYSDEANSFGAITEGMPCMSRRQYAKNYDSGDIVLYAVQFIDGRWFMPQISVTNGPPRMWYLVLSRCNNLTFSVTYDTDFLFNGVYHRGQGPLSCAIDGGFNQYAHVDRVPQLSGAFIAFFFITIVFALALVYQCRRARFLQHAPVAVKGDEHEMAPAKISHHTTKEKDDDELEEEGEA